MMRQAMRFGCLVVVVMMACAVPVRGQGVPWVFYDGFESGDTSGWWAPARVGQTGQVTCYDEAGAVIPCTGTGQDGELRPGVPWPVPRFEDNGDGTVTDMLTGLVWLKNADCFGERTWVNALADASGLASGACGLTDGSVAGDWRLPSGNELQSLLNYEYFDPALSNAAGTGQWTEGDAFSGVQSYFYWSLSSSPWLPTCAVSLRPDHGVLMWSVKTNGNNFVWPVRAGFGDTSGWWAPARVGQTGQVTCYDELGAVIPCAGTGQDGELRPGVPWPVPRFEDNGDGTVTDMLTGLVWLKNANCFGARTWVNALADASVLASGACGLTDGSVAGDWRLPSVNELHSLVNYEYFEPTLSNAAGTGQWTEGDAFSGVQSDWDDFYWSSSSSAWTPFNAMILQLYTGSSLGREKTSANSVWPVRAGQ